MAAECEATDDPLKRSFFFYDTDDATDDGTATGTLLDTWTLPRTQSSIENCTLHNYNVVPLRNGRDVLVHGSYQSGTSAVDFTELDAGRSVDTGRDRLVRPTAHRASDTR